MGYQQANRKGVDLWQTTVNNNLTLITDPAFPTRIGNSCSRDTTPDLFFIRNVESASWSNLQVDLGSDHNILATSVNVRSGDLKEFTITDWDYFRKIREERAQTHDSALSLEQWLNS